MKQLHFGCSYSDIWVSPENWATTTAKASLKKSWYVQCYFFDPEHKGKYPAGFPYRKKCNRGGTIEERRALVKFYLDEIPELFEKKGYNPITGVYMIQQPLLEELPKPERRELDKRLEVPAALKLAMAKISGGDEYKNEVRIAINRFCKSLDALGKSSVLIKDMTFAHLNDTVAHMKLPSDYANKCRQYFIAVFRVLKKYQCCEMNLATDLDIHSVLRKPREVLDMESLQVLWAHLKGEHYTLYRYAQIFFFSGTRSTELFSVQAKHVNIDRQEYNVVVKKGKQYVWETKVILKNAIHLWRELLSQCKDPEDYLFSYNREPGSEPGNPKQITKRWRQHVKSKLAIYKGEVWTIAALEINNLRGYTRIPDFYTQKHSFLDLMDQRQTANDLGGSEIHDIINGLNLDDATKGMLLARLASGLDFDVAQKMAAHRSVGLTNKVYKVSKARRENEHLKKLEIKL